MSSKRMVIALAIAILISAGFAVAAEAEFTIVNTAVLPASSLSLSGILPMASLTPAAPTAPKINLDPQREFGGFVRGEKLESALFTTSLVAMTTLNVADYLSTKQAFKFSGLQEGNPLMKPFVKNPALFAAVKAGTTAWVLTMASNFILSYVVSNNMRLIQKARLR